MAVQCKFAKMGAHLKDLKGNQRGSLVSRIEQAEPVEAE
jgi:hypothetical protein